MGLQLASLLRCARTNHLGLQFLLTATLLALPSTALMTRAAELEGGFEIIQLSDMNWDEDSERVQQRILYGDPAKEGFYIIRLRFPAGATSRPHYHSTDRFITVIEGTWNAGIDASHDMTATTPIPAGGYMLHPAGAVHYDGSRGGPVVVEIRGFGPVVTTSVDIEP